MQSFWGSDGRFYCNELCLDAPNGETIASKEIQKMVTNDIENELLQIWHLILERAKTTKNYDSKLTYGIHQIATELDTFTRDEETD